MTAATPTSAGNHTVRTDVLALLLLAVVSLPVSLAQAAYPSFQELLDQADPTLPLVPPAGTYAGPVVVEDPITIDGRNGVTIDAGGKGSVIILKTDGATLRNLHLTNSGDSHNDIDAGIQVRGNFNVIKDNVIDNCLFGIDLQQSNNNVVRRNRISSKDVELGVRGDAIRLWYSFDNKIVDNDIRDSRDTVVWYSRDNLISGNKAHGGRYALHFMYSQYNRVEYNEYSNNAVGIFVMYSDGVEIRHNRITHSIGATGMGIGFKETSDVVVEHNDILYTSAGLYLDVSPYQPDTINHIRNNRIAFNGVGVLFHSDWHGNEFRDNLFKANGTQVVVRGGGGATRHLWRGNQWDDYQGFDLDRDGSGDTPYETYAYADRLWMDVPSAKYFRGAPVLEALDFLERLAPFSEPTLLVRDPAPKLHVADVGAADKPPGAGEFNPFGL